MAIVALAMGGVSCKKNPFAPYEKVFITATINGRQYKESATWGWNQQLRLSSIALYENHKVIRFIPRLSPEKEGDVRYEIQFYIAVDDTRFKTNHPYKIDFYNTDAGLDKILDVEYIHVDDVIAYVSENREQVLAAGADGMAFALSSTSEEPIPLKGELVMETISPETGRCKGSFTLASSGSDSEKLVINGTILDVSSYISSLFFE